MDGLEATRHIRESLVPLAPPPIRTSIPQPVIVALTANAFEEDRQKCLNAGMDDVLTKPIDKALLETTLQKIARARALGLQM